VFKNRKAYKPSARQAAASWVACPVGIAAVPFQPSGDKPVYCRDCFERVGRPAGMEGLSEVVADPRFATGVGLLRATAPAVAAGESVPERAGRFALGLHQFKRAIASLI
jgi:CxxC-x17-CxxC domain-containing protein